MAKSVYGRVRAGKAMSLVRGQKVARSLGGSALTLSPALGAWAAPVGLVTAAVGVGLVALGTIGRGKIARNAMRTAVVARLVGSAKAAKANAPARAMFGARADSKLFGLYDRMTTGIENGAPGSKGLGKAQQSLQNYYSLVAGSKRRSDAAASISRARQVVDRTAAARSMAASRKAVPRPAAGRRPAAEQRGGDGQTEGYYRNQGGKRVFVQGYATPPGRSR